MIARIKADCNCRRNQKRLVIPVKLALTRPIIRLGRRSGWAFRHRAQGFSIGSEEWMGMGSSANTVDGTTPGARSGQGDAVSPFPLLPAVASPQRSTTPPLHYSIACHSIPREIPCNLCRRFPLYGVEAGSLPGKAAQRIAKRAVTKPEIMQNQHSRKVSNQ